MRYFLKDGLPWFAQADHGMEPTGGNLIYLDGHVEMTSIRTRTQARPWSQTPSIQGLHTNIASTDDPVTIVKGDSHMHGIGMDEAGGADNRWYQDRAVGLVTKKNKHLKAAALGANFSSARVAHGLPCPFRPLACTPRSAIARDAFKVLISPLGLAVFLSSPQDQAPGRSRIDKTQPINVHSDHGDFQSRPQRRQQRCRHLQWHVVTQGSIVITVDKAVLRIVDNELTPRTIRNPATFVQQGQGANLYE